MRFRVDGETLDNGIDGAGQRIEQRQPLHLFVEQLNAQRQLVRFRREDVNHLAAHAKGAALERLIVAGVLQLRQATQNGALVDDHPFGEMQHHLQVEIRVAQTIDSGDRRHHHHIAPLQQRFGGRQTHLLNVLVYRRVLLNKGIGTRHIRFRLIVVVVRDEIFHGVFREELFHLAIELRRQRFVRCQHHRRALQIGDDVRHGERFPRARHTQQRLVRQPVLQPFLDAADSLRLVAGRFESGIEFERFAHEETPDEDLRGQSVNFTRHSDFCQR